MGLGWKLKFKRLRIVKIDQGKRQVRMRKVCVFDMVYKNLWLCDFAEVFLGSDKKLHNYSDVKKIFERKALDHFYNVVLILKAHFKHLDRIRGRDFSRDFKKKS